MANFLEIGFTGTQEGMTDAQKRRISQLYKILGKNTKLHHGDCIGADKQQHEITRKYGFNIIGHPPIKKIKRAFCDFNETRDLKDYISRNHDIVDEGKDLLVATPKETNHKESIRSGTWATIRYARKLNRKILIIWPDGKKQLEN